MPAPADPREIEGRRTTPAGLVLITGLIALGLGTLLNASSLLKTAERQPLGSTGRDVAVGIMDPLADVSSLLFLDKPRELIERAIGRYEPEPAGPAGIAVITTATPITEPSVLLPVGPESSTTTSTTAPGDDPGTGGAATTGATAPPLPTPGEDDPMFLWIIGDSFVELFGPALRNDSAETGVIDSEVDFRFISGLTRPDHFDWPAHIESRIPEVLPDAVVVVFGGNDGQPMVVDGEHLAPDSEPWVAVYHQLVGEVMDRLLDGGVPRVYWVGLPIMRDDTFSERVRLYNSVYADEAAARPGVEFVDIYELFADENGAYSTYLRTSGGDLLLMRSEDGAHYSWNGAYRLSAFVLEAIAADWGFADRL